MQVVVLANESMKQELLAQGADGQLELHWIATFRDFAQFPDADGYIDLMYEHSQERIDFLKELTTKPVFINHVPGTLEGLQWNFVRINGWPTFLSRTIMEAAAKLEIREAADQIINALHKKAEWVADVPGFISVRVVSMIINEAYYTLSEEVSSKEETDIAMKLGTNYPYGPFEWAQKIGLKNIVTILEILSKSEPRYQPSTLLQKEAS